MPSIHRHRHTGAQMLAKCNDCGAWGFLMMRTWECVECGGNDYIKPDSCYVCRPDLGVESYLETSRRMRLALRRSIPSELGPHDRRPDDRRPDPFKDEKDQ